MRDLTFSLLLIPAILNAQWSAYDERVPVQDIEAGAGPHALEFVRHGDGSRTAAISTMGGSIQLLRIDPEGDATWRMRVQPSTTTASYWLYGAVGLPENGVALLVGYAAAPTLFDVLRFDPSGQLLLSKQYTFSPTDTSSLIGIPRMIALPSGDLVLAACRAGVVSITELAPDGGVVWSTGFRPMLGSMEAPLSSLAVSTSGDLLVMGNSINGPRYIARLNAEGSVQWSKRYYTTQAPAYDYAIPMDDGTIRWISWPDGGPAQMAQMDGEGTILNYWTLQWPSNPYQQPLIPKHVFAQPDGTVLCEGSVPFFVMRLGTDLAIQGGVQLDQSTPFNTMIQRTASWIGDSLSFAMLFQDTLVFDDHVSMELSSSTVPQSCWLDQAVIERTPSTLSHNTTIGYVADPMVLTGMDVDYAVEIVPTTAFAACGGIPQNITEEPARKNVLEILGNPADAATGINGYAYGGGQLELVDARGAVVWTQRISGTGARSGFKLGPSGLSTGLYTVLLRETTTGRMLAREKVVVR